jgi:hypothetical protein
VRTSYTHAAALPQAAIAILLSVFLAMKTNISLNNSCLLRIFHSITIIIYDKRTEIFINTNRPFKQAKAGIQAKTRSMNRL